MTLKTEVEFYAELNAIEIKLCTASNAISRVEWYHHKQENTYKTHIQNT